MVPFALAEPQTLEEARALLDPEDPGVRALAGGTALMLLMRSGLFRPERLVGLHRIEPCYRAIEAAGDGVRIGAMTTLSSIEGSAAVREAAPVVTRALRRLSNVRVRNVATLGGHLAHADPHMDLPTVLTALGARATVAGDGGEREVEVESLYRGYMETSLEPTDLISQVRVPAQGRTRAVYLKCTTRSADDWPALGVAVVLDADAERIHGARVVVGAATDRPTVIESAAEVLAGASVDGSGTVDPDRLREAGEAAAAAVHPRTDARGSAAYKRELIRVYVRRAVAAAMAQPTEGVQ